MGGIPTIKMMGGVYDIATYPQKKVKKTIISPRQVDPPFEDNVPVEKPSGLPELCECTEMYGRVDH